MSNLDRRIAAHARQLQALELRLAGVTYEQIATQLGYASRSGAHRAVESALKQTLREPAEALRELSAQRLDRATTALWRRVQDGDAHAIDVLLRIEARRARLLGLDAPASLEQSACESVVRLIRLEPGPAAQMPDGNGDQEARTDA
jgi:hypothetical protein